MSESTSAAIVAVWAVSGLVVVVLMLGVGRWIMGKLSDGDYAFSPSAAAQRDRIHALNNSVDHLAEQVDRKERIIVALLTLIHERTPGDHAVINCSEIRSAASNILHDAKKSTSRTKKRGHI